MTLALCLLAVTTLVAFISLAAVAARSTLATGPSLVGRTVVVHTRDGRTIRGLLHGQHADRWTLREAVFVHTTGDQPLGGLEHIPVANISHVQELQAPAVERS